MKRLVLKINKGPTPGTAPSVVASTVSQSTTAVPSGVQPSGVQPSGAASTSTTVVPPTQTSTAPTTTPSSQHISHEPVPVASHTPHTVGEVTDAVPQHAHPAQSGTLSSPSSVPPTAVQSGTVAGPPKPMTLTVTSGGRTITIKPLAKPGTAPTPTTPTHVPPTPSNVTPVNLPPVTSPPVARPKFVLKTKLTFKLPRKVCEDEVEKMKQADTPKPQLKLKIAFPSKEREESVTPATATRKRKALYDLEEESSDEEVETPRRIKRARMELDEQSEDHAVDHESESDFANQPKLPMSEVMQHLLTELTARDTNAYYRHEITEDVAPQYFEIIKQPMWFDKMAEKLNNNEYPTLVSFQKDFELICKNAMEYNRASTPWHKEARRLLREGKQLIDKWTKRLEPNDLALHLDAVNAAALASVSTKRETRERERERESESESHPHVKKSLQAEVGRVSDLVKRKFAGAQQSVAPVTAHHPPAAEMSSGVMLPPRASISSAQLFQATRQLKSPYPSVPVTLTPAPGAHHPPGLHSRAAHATNPAAHQYSPMITSRASSQFLSPYVSNFVAFSSSTPAASTHIVAPQIIKIPINDVSYTASLEHFVHSLDGTAQSRVRKFIQELRTGPTSATSSAPHGESAQSRVPAVLTAANTLGTSPAELKAALQNAAQLGLDVSALTGLLTKLDGSELSLSAAPPVNAVVITRKDALLNANQSALLKLQALQEERSGDATLVSPTEQQLVREVGDNLKSVMDESVVPMTE